MRLGRSNKNKLREFLVSGCPCRYLSEGLPGNLRDERGIEDCCDEGKHEGFERPRGRVDDFADGGEDGVSRVAYFQCLRTADGVLDANDQAPGLFDSIGQRFDKLYRQLSALLPVSLPNALRRFGGPGSGKLTPHFRPSRANTAHTLA